MNARKRRAIFTRLAEDNPNPHTELVYHTTFELLVAVILSAQATDKSVNTATAKLFRKVNTPEAVVRLGVQGLKRYIRTIGLYNNKAKNIVATARLLLERHDGAVPHDRTALEALPGVGRKTANVILNTAFGEPVIAVDTHVFRVANRTGLARGKTPREVESKLERSTPAEYRHNAHHWLILLGRYTCKAHQPECWRCPIAEWCEYPNKTPPPVRSSPVSRRASARRGKAPRAQAPHPRVRAP